MGIGKYALVTTWTAADTTLGKVAFLGVLAKGSAADSTITIYNGTDIKYVLVAGSTVNNIAFTQEYPVAFSNLIVDLTGTASYAICYIPTTR